MKYFLTVYQENHTPTGLEKVILGEKTLLENDQQKNLEFVLELTRKSESDGVVYGIVTEDVELEYRPAWKVNPYEKTQYMCGFEVIDKVTGEKRLEGDEGPEDY